MANLKVVNPLDLNAQRATNAADASADTDLATLGQVKNLANGRDWKESARAASTGNVSVTSAPAAIDGVTLANGDRVLLKNQTTGSENGIRVFTGAGAALNRATDGAAGNLTAGATVYVTEGTANADTQWTLTTDDPITVGTTALTFVQSGSTSPDIAATNGGLQKVGNAFSVLTPAGGGVVTDATGTHIDTAVVARRFAQSIGDGTSTVLNVDHNFGTRDVTVQVYDASTNAEVWVDNVRSTINRVVINWAGTAPALNAYRVVVVG